MDYMWMFPTLIAGLVIGRMFGGWLGVRGAIMRATPVLWGLPAWFLLDWVSAAIITLASLAQWDDGHRFDRPWHLAWRYSRYSMILVAVTSFYPALLIGPLSGCFAWSVNKWRLPALSFPWDTSTQQMIDGPYAYWESLTRALSAVAWVAAAIYSKGVPWPLVMVWDDAVTRWNLGVVHRIIVYAFG